MASDDTLVNALTSDKSAEETTGKRIAGGVSVDNLGVCKGRHGEDLWFIGCGRGDEDGGRRALGDDDGTGAGGVGFGQRRERLGDRGDVLLVGESGGACPCSSLALISDDDVAVGEDLLELNFEELGDEGGR